MITHRFIQTATLLFALFLFGTVAHADEKWTVKGKIKISHLLPELKTAFGTSNGLAGIKVRLHARSRVLTAWGTWNSWGTVVTGADGSFKFTETHGADRRQFKVEILFDSDELRLKEGQETSVNIDNKGFPIDIDFDLTDKDWFLVHDDKDDGPDDGRKAGTIDLGDIQVSGTIAKKLADIWFLYNKIFDKVDSYGSAYSFGKKITLKYPMGVGNNGQNTASYCNPLNNNIYIKQEHFNASTLTHELCHAWAYFHSTGEDAITWQLLKHGETHQDRENTTFVPFHEGFAEWASYKLLEEITDGKLRNFEQASNFDKPHVPLNRAYIAAVLDPSEESLANVDYTERGWHSLFNILTYNGLGACNFNETASNKYAVHIPNLSCPEAALKYSLKELLSVFLKNTSKGLSADIKREEMNFNGFFKRARLVLPGLTEEKESQIKSYLNPKAEENPRDYYCKPKLEVQPGAVKKPGPIKNPGTIKNNGQ